MIRVSTPRLLLLPMRPNDVEVFESLLSVEDIGVEFPSFASQDRESLAMNMDSRLRNPEHMAHPWLWVINKTTEQIVGFLMARDYRAPVRGKQIYYALHPTSRGRGFAAEALRGLTDHFLREESIELVFVRGERENVASEQVMRSAGYCPVELPEFSPRFFGYAGDAIPADAVRIITNFAKQRV